MLLIAAAILVGMAVGFAMGGSIKTLSELHLRWWGLAFLGLALQLIPVRAHGGAVALLIGSYVILVVFLLRNVGVAGMPLMAVGFALNVLVIGVNGGMPVRDAALRRAAGPFYQQTLRRLTVEGGAKHHLERADDDLVPLADVIPIGAPVRQVLSLGDVMWLLGTAWVVASGMSGRDEGTRSDDPGQGAAGTSA